MLDSLAASILESEDRIAQHVRRTPLLRSSFYSNLIEGNVYLKCENLQSTGSFKIRGAFNYLLSLDDVAAERGVVAASTGNHGQAVASAGRQLGIRCFVFAPQNALVCKLDAVLEQGAEIRLIGDDALTAETAARQFAADQKMSYVSPYNDPVIVQGQGTIAVEICRQCDEQGIGGVDALFASLGGGGLISGVGSYLKTAFPDCQIIGCSPANSDVMIQSIDAGQIVNTTSLPTLADGSAGGIEAGAITFPLCQQLLDQMHSVNEDEIAESLIEFIDHHGMLIEGAAATCIAGLKKDKQRWKGKTVVVTLCGANISTDVLKSVLS